MSKRWNAILRDGGLQANKHKLLRGMKRASQCPCGTQLGVPEGCLLMRVSEAWTLLEAGQCEVAWIGFILAEYAVDAGAWWPLKSPGGERFDSAIFAMQPGFDTAIVTVANPADQPEFAGFVTQRPTVTDALNATGDGEMPG